MTGTGRPTATLPLWRALAPFAIAAALLVWLLHDVDRGEVTAGVRQLAVPGFVGLLVVLGVTSLVVDAATSWAIYRRMLGPLRLGDLLAIRAASFLPGIINYHAGQAWLTWVLVRARVDDPYRATAATLVSNAATLASLTLATALAWAAGPPVDHAWLVALVVGGVVVVVSYLGVLAVRPSLLSGRRLLAPLFQLGVAGHLWAVVIRLPSVVVSFAIVWLPLHWFGVAIPLRDALYTVPPVVVLAALPITPAGLGSRDVVAAALLAGFATGTPEQQRATVVACTLLTGLGMSVVQIALSLAFTPRARRVGR